MDDWLWIVIAFVALIVLVLVLVAVVSRARHRRRTADLQARFGPEYETAVHRYGRGPGEQHLEELLRAHGSRRLRDVDPAERDAALQSWDAVQTSFVEAPVASLREADQLVFGVLRERGYPLETVDQRASAISVDEPELASRYRSAHATLARAEASEDGADVGSLRDALLTYRDLLHELVGAPNVPGRLTTRADAPSESTSDSMSDSASDSASEPASEPVSDSMSARASEPVPDSMSARASDPVPERGSDQSFPREESWTSTRTDTT